jgi:molecular chaperone GrpE
MAEQDDVEHGGVDLDEDAIDPGSTLAKLMAENTALKDQAMRYAAEAENTRRRAEREANDARAYAIQKFARDLLDAADNLSRAVQHAPREVVDATVSNFVMGVEMSDKALQTAFERNGLKRVEPRRGDKFDPHLHQAMMEQPAEGVPPGGVIQVLQPGYELFGRIVRPAMVAVTPKGGAPEAPAAADAGSPTSSEGANPYGHGGPGASGSTVDAKA